MAMPLLVHPIPPTPTTCPPPTELPFPEVAALDRVVVKFRREGTSVELVGLSEASATMIDQFAEHDKLSSDAPLAAH